MDFHAPPSGPTAVAAPAAVVDSESSGPSGDEEVAVEVGVDEVLDPKPKKTLEEAESREHRMTHLPKNPHCEVCSKAKMQRKPKRSKSSKPSAAEEAKPQPTRFGEQVTGDHFIKGGRDEEEGPFFPCDTVAVVLYDRGTRYLAVYPKSAKNTADTIAAMQRFAGPKDKIQRFHSDNAPELTSAATALKWRLATATTGMPQTNGVAENCVRRCKEGGGCAIVQSGFNPKTFWPFAGEHFCFANNIAIVNGDSAWNKRHKKGRFKGMQFPFGALVDFMPQPDVRVESMGPKTLPGVFIGYHVNPGGEWSGDYLVADLAYFRENPDVVRSKVKIHRIKEAVPILDGKFVFPVAVWRHERLLKADNFDVPAEVEEVEPLDDVDLLDIDVPRPPGCSRDVLVA